MIRLFVTLGILCFTTKSSFYQADPLLLVQKVKAKLDAVNDYVAEGLMKTNVSFLKVPEAHVKVYFKRPDKLKIKNDQGISLVPKGALSMSLNNLLASHFTAIEMPSENMEGIKVRVIKLLPNGDNGEIVLSTLYIDEGRLLVRRAVTTTRDNGSYEVNMYYGNFIRFALPDKVVFIFNTKDYKLPKGITFDYDDGIKKKTENTVSSNKGSVEISYSSYLINKGIPDIQFQ